MSRAKIFPLLLAAAALAGCRAAPQAVQPSPELPLIAVLPFDNQTTDLEAPAKARQAFYKELQARGYRLVEPAQVDTGLKTLGITNAGRLRVLPPEKLAAAVPAELYCYGNVLDFAFKSVVALSQRRVALAVKMTRPDGKVIFEGTEEAVNAAAGENAAGELALNVAGKLFKSVKDGAKRLVSGDAKPQADVTDKVADVDLAQETSDVVRKLADKFRAAGR